MKPVFAACVLALAASATAGTCTPGIYRGPGGDFAVVSEASRYLFRDGRRGGVGDLDCDQHGLREGKASWPREALRETDTRFDSAGASLAGRLLQPAGPPGPLVVLVHGSEKTSPRAGTVGLALAAQGLSVFMYDKRGTGASQGEYTQNFELLADDAAAALRHARGLAGGRAARSGFYGGSQGGWVAPLAATRSPADFVAVGFGLVNSPIDEDREQMLDEAERLQLGPAARARIEQLSALTARVLRSHFTEGLEALEAFRREVSAEPWAARIAGEHSGAMLRSTDAELRRIGRARFDNLELIWDYDAQAALKKLGVPLLWVLAAEDREAPIAATRDALLGLAKAGQAVDVYVFPDTDHGMVEFVTEPDGQRRYTKIAEGYLPLLADWIAGRVKGPYGRGRSLR